MGKFLYKETPLLTVMLQCETPETVIGRIRNANYLGADAYGIQIETLKPEYHNPETYKRMFDEMKGRPSYVTYYREKTNLGKTDEELAQGLITLAESGATLCDVMGDMFCPEPEQMTYDEEAVKKQMELIDKIHAAGAEVIMSAHILKFKTAEQVLAIAKEQKRRGADIIKMVVRASSMQEQMENLRITDLLKQELDAPFIFLSVGDCSLHRRLGIKLGCCMCFCVYEHDALSTPTQPLLTTMKTIRDNLDL